MNEEQTAELVNEIAPAEDTAPKLEDAAARLTQARTVLAKAKADRETAEAAEKTASENLKLVTAQFNEALDAFKVKRPRKPKTESEMPAPKPARDRKKK